MPDVPVLGSGGGGTSGYFCQVLVARWNAIICDVIAHMSAEEISLSVFFCQISCSLIRAANENEW